MKIVLTLSSDRSIYESIKATLPTTDMVLFECTIDDTLRRLVSITPDIIIMDDSPSFGLSTLAELNSNLPHIPVIVLCTNTSKDALSSYLMAGAMACIPKPFDCATLRGHVESVTSTSTQIPSPSHTHAQRPILDNALTQHQQALRWMSRNTTNLDNPERLTQSLLDAIMDIMEPVRAAILLLKDGAIKVTHSQGHSENVTESVQLSFTQGLMRHLEAHTSLIDKHHHGMDESTHKELNALGGHIAIPISTQGHACGVLVVGEKYSGQEYSASERELLITMTRYSSTCLERSQQHYNISVEQNRLNTVLSTISAGVVIVSPDNKITMINESAERILQLKAIDIVGHNTIKLGSAFADIVLRTMREGIARNRQVIRDVAINATLGLSVTPLGSEGVVAIFSRIPEPDSKVDNTTEDDAISYSPLWEYLATRVAQEIKNPMVPINTYAQLLPAKFDSKDFREEFSEVVQESVGRINKVVESIYDFAKHPRLDLKNNNLNESIQRLLDTYQDQFSEKHIEIETQMDETELTVSVDSQLFTRAVGNVIQNSIEAMPEGGTLKIKTAKENGMCTLSLSDSGEGITEQDAELIFMPFFSTKEKGMGLGLTMAERIIKEHDGRLEFDSNTTEGGRFILQLPTKTPSPS